MGLVGAGDLDSVTQSLTYQVMPLGCQSIV